MDIFVSSYDDKKTITFGKIDKQGKMENVYEEHLNNLPSYIKKYDNYLYVAQKKADDENSLGIMEYKILDDRLEKMKLYRSLASFTHIYVNKKYIIGASYHQGLVQIFEKNTNKSITKIFPNSKIHNVGYIDNIEKYYAVDLAGNCIYFFEIKNNEFVNEKIVNLEKDDMPRHIWHSSGNAYLYIVNENSSKVKVLDLENEYRWIQEIDTVTEKCGNNPAAIMSDEEGRYVFVSNRGKNNVVVFKVMDNKGGLKYWYEINDFFENPRDLYIKNGILYVASQDTNEVKVFKLYNLAKKYECLQSFNVNTPVCIEI